MFRPHLDAVEVLSGLWLGSCPSHRQARQLASMAIDSVIDLRAEGPPVEWPDGVEVARFALVDHGTPTTVRLSETAEAVVRRLRAGATVFVHCHAGQQRAPTVVCAALMRMGWSLDDAYRRVLEVRPGAMPTEGQLLALRELAGPAPLPPEPEPERLPSIRGADQ